MFGRAKALLTIAAFSWAAPVGAQAPTTAFDGTYTGVTRTLEGTMMNQRTRHCAESGRAAPLKIVDGIARTAWWSGTAEGSVSPQGVLVMRAPNGAKLEGQIDGRGTVTGRFSSACNYQMVWQKKAK